MIFRRRASPLHATRAAAGGAYCLALAVCALSFQHPLILAAVIVATVGAGAGAGASHDLVAAARFTVPLAILVAVVNPFVIHEGLTVFWRFGNVPPFGEIDLTLEALVYGLLLGLRVVAVALCCALFVAAVDPDETLQLFRRISFRSALTAALAACARRTPSRPSASSSAHGAPRAATSRCARSNPGRRAAASTRARAPTGGASRRSTRARAARACSARAPA